MKKISRMLLEETKKEMTDEEFFTSSSMKEHLQTIIEGICKTYNRNITATVIPKADFVARTDGDDIKISLNSDFVKAQETRQQKYYAIIGLILHECGHVLYTDFALLKKAILCLAANGIYPSITIGEELDAMLKDGKGAILIPVYKSLENCIEDGFIERLVIKDVPGYGECLTKVRKMHMEDSSILSYDASIKKAAETGKELDRISMMLNMVLFYAKYSMDLTDGIEDDLTDSFKDIQGIIDKAMKSYHAPDRMKQINIVFDKIVKFIDAEIGKKSEEKPDPEMPDSKESEEESKADISSADGSATDDEKEEESEEKPDPEMSDSKESEEESKADISSADGSATDDEKEKEPESVESSTSGSADDSADPEDTEKDSGDEKEADKSSTSSSADDSADPEDTKEDSDDAKSRELSKKMEETLKGLEKDLKSMEDMSDHTRASSKTVTAKDDGDLDSSEAAEDGEMDISHLEEKAAEEMISKEIHNRIEREMVRTQKDMYKTRKDKYPGIMTYLQPDRYAKEEYEVYHQELDRIARRVKKNLDKVIKQRRRGDVKKGLYVGKQFDAPHAYRKDKRIFSQKILPENIPDMDVCVLVDCSGSMSSDDRMEQARNCAYITWQFCSEMQIPCSVYGHTTNWHPETHVKINCVAHPMNIDSDDGKRIFMLRADADNRDGWAVNFCGEALTKSTATNKLLLIISDGLPAADGYYGPAAKRDHQDVVKKYKQKGIKIVTAGIDDCALDIKRVYQDGAQSKYAAKFLDYSDMSKLPQAFATLIKKELL